ncbi:hypothetical protein NQ317_019615 [Molorchus minor]|uniref:3'-5' exonuclease n=1 Tax=Molorchus minor TaxID=1323400 RepID=A0ABQ9J4X6_9CUCU|nr:hypothetical protein NQ317_019615 [Molorchus minor]
MDMLELGMKLRSQISPAEREAKRKKEKQKEAWDKRPYIKYNGKIKYHTELIDCAMLCDTLLETANRCEDIMVVGFDMEWPFSYQTGPERTAVIQISPDLDNCYILHVTKLKNLPKGLSEFLAHPKVRLTGNNIKNDVRKLARDFKGFNVDRLVENCIDLGVMANSILPINQRWSLAALVEYILELKINKDKKVRMSKWHVIPLTKKQQTYAAIDAYVSLLLYQKLKERENQVFADENAVIN